MRDFVPVKHARLHHILKAHFELLLDQLIDGNFACCQIRYLLLEDGPELFLHLLRFVRVVFGVFLDLESASTRSVFALALEREEEVHLLLAELILAIFATELSALPAEIGALRVKWDLADFLAHHYGIRTIFLQLDLVLSALNFLNLFWRSR